MFETVDVLFLLIVMWLHLYAFVNANYCEPPDGINEYASVRFCESGTVSSSNVYINGSSTVTKESLADKECVCLAVWNRNDNLLVRGFNSCKSCGLVVTFADFVFNPSTGSWDVAEIEKTSVTNVSFKMSISSELSVSSEFCLLLRAKNQNNVNVTITCEGLYTSTTASTASTSRNQTSTATSELLTSMTKQPSGTETISTAPHNQINSTENNTATTGLQGSKMGKSSSNTNDVVIPAAIGGGSGVLIILVIIIVACCIRKKGRDAENPIYMKEVDTSDAIMTDNPTYGKSVDTDTNSISHIGPQCTGDVYAVVNKESNSNVPPLAEVSHMKVGETGDIYAIVKKENAQEIPNREHSRGQSAKSSVQKRSNQDSIAFGIEPSTDCADIAIENTGPKRPVIKVAVTVDYA